MKRPFYLMPIGVIFYILWYQTHHFWFGLLAFACVIIYQVVVFKQDTDGIRRVAMLSMWTGFLGNLLCLSANGGYMPVVSHDPNMQYGAHVLATSSSHLMFLADWINLGNVAIMSIGDCFIFGGIFIGVFSGAIRWVTEYLTDLYNSWYI